MSDACSLTPRGYFDQELVSIDRKPFYVECVIDPHNGEPRYTIRRPWQGVHGQ